MKIALTDRTKENLAGFAALGVALSYGLFTIAAASALAGWLEGFWSTVGFLVVLGFGLAGWYGLIALFIYPHEKRALAEFEEARCIEAEMDGRM